MIQDTYSRRDFMRLTGAAGLSLAALSAPAALADEPADDAPAGGDTIYIVDRLHCKPATGKEIFDLYTERYVPGALERGMTLVTQTVQPPIWLEDEVSNNTLTFVWSVPGMMGWAAMVGVSRYDPQVSQELIAFWRDMDERLESRERTFSAPEADVLPLTTLERLGA